jgi:Transposase DDE domain
MPQRDQHNATESLSQAQEAAQHCWNDLVQRLPAELETQARNLGAFQRVRAVPNAQALLRAVLCYVLSQYSLTFLSGWSRLNQVSTKVLSAQAWNKRLRLCGPWLLWLLTSLLDVRLETRALPTHERILLVDATHLSEMGKSGETWRLHCAYDLLKGQLAWVQVSDHSQGESLARLPIQAGDILVADKAYSKAPQLLAVDAAGAFTLARFSAWHLPLFARSAPAETSEFRLDVRGWLSGLRPGTFQRHAVVFSDSKRLPVRLIVVVLPDEQAEALRERARLKAREKGSKLSEQSLFYAGFHLVVTTLPDSRWPAALVLELYRCRWQIEILFKRLKQVLDTHRLSCSSPQTAQVMILALLVAWLLIEDEATELQRQITDGEPLSLPLSSWQLNQWAWEGLRNVVRGWWSPAQLRAIAPSLRRLLSHKRQRPRLEHQRRVRFLSLLGAAVDLVSLFDCSSTLS